MNGLSEDMRVADLDSSILLVAILLMFEFVYLNWIHDLCAPFPFVY